MHYQLIVIGAGPGGYIAALKAAQQGLKVAIIEKSHLGGTCLNWGCVPSKALLASAEIMHHAQHAAEWGVTIGGPIGIDWTKVQARKDKILSGLRGGIGGLLRARKVDLLSGNARLDGPGKVVVDDGKGGVVTHSADHVIVASGSSVVRIPGWPTDAQKVCTSDEAVHWETLPKKLVIVGGGVIGCEFACIMNAVGVDVSIVELMPQLLATPGLDSDLGIELAKVFTKRGITIHTGRKVAEVSLVGDGVTATLDDGTKLAADRLLVSVGRKPNSSGIGLESVGITLSNRGFVPTQDTMATQAAGVWAIGDVNGRCLLAHAASAHGVAAVENLVANLHGKAGHAFSAPIPSAVYTFPEIGAVGLTEADAKAQGLPISVGRFPLAHLGKALAANDAGGFVKVIRHRETDAILGVHALGHGCTEIIAAASVLLHTKATVHDLAEAVFAHPTISEAIKEAAEDALGAALHLPPRKLVAVVGA
jgi:dihydrolipoamide dehydrogenase